ncbi:MAG TPA: glycoside hydrolase family 20 zincin-like fold domain-containing protein [Verrucomicrobiae bacterium]|nr:glycoside hydrolase family 20 zincin-like fold domain-containing protein [Verrucomicrobiae bacterium]
MKSPALLPCPRSLKILRGTFTLPERRPPVRRSAGVPIGRAGSETGVPAISFRQSNSAPNHPEGYALTISQNGIEIAFREAGGLRAAVATLRQLLRQYGRRLPCLKIRDWPDFPRRGVMLDVSRGRVPKLETLLELAERLADLKINELQLYTEHTFAYRRFRSVWQSWGALTGWEIRKLDARCRQLGIDLVPNQNSFGHLRHFLEHPRLKPFAEVLGPYEDESGDFDRRPSTLAPNHPGTLPFLRGLYDELLPKFSSRYFNVGCDETWDLGRGQSKNVCDAKGQGRVYLDFLKKIHHEVSRRGKIMMFWGDIILKYPKLISELASFGTPVSDPARRVTDLNRAGSETGAPGIIALNWGYEANHPFEKEARQFARSKIPFYVCPGTSTWQTLIGRHDNALANLRAAARAGHKYGAAGYLITDWGDGGHPQPLAVGWPMFLAGASLAWNATGFNEQKLVPVLSRDVFGDSTGKVARAALQLGLVHRKLKVRRANETPLGTVIAAPPPADRELFCRNGLKWFARIPAKNIRATLQAIERQRAVVKTAWRAGLRPGVKQTAPLATRRVGDRRSAQELDLAARMAIQSCWFMLWQQAVAAGKRSKAKRLAQTGIRELQKLEKDFDAYWPLCNKATPKHCSAFLRWRINDYQRSF